MTRPKETNSAGRHVLERIRKIKPFLLGSLTETLKCCGNPQCRCAQEGPIHPVLLLTWKEGQKTKSVYVPPRLKREVMTWLDEGKRLKQFMNEMARAQRAFLHEKKQTK
jgi:hypothetical protein